MPPAGTDGKGNSANERTVHRQNQSFLTVIRFSHWTAYEADHFFLSDSISTSIAKLIINVNA
jgi:hypothetical protein